MDKSGRELCGVWNSKKGVPGYGLWMNQILLTHMFTTPLMRVCVRASYDVSGGIGGGVEGGKGGGGKRGGVLRISRLSESFAPPKCVQVAQCRTGSHK